MQLNNEIHKAIKCTHVLFLCKSESECNCWNISLFLSNGSALVSIELCPNRSSIPNKHFYFSYFSNFVRNKTKTIRKKTKIILWNIGNCIWKTHYCVSIHRSWFCGSSIRYKKIKFYYRSGETHCIKLWISTQVILKFHEPNCPQIFYLSTFSQLEVIK